MATQYQSKMTYQSVAPKVTSTSSTYSPTNSSMMPKLTNVGVGTNAPVIYTQPKSSVLGTSTAYKTPTGANMTSAKTGLPAVGYISGNTNTNTGGSGGGGGTGGGGGGGGSSYSPPAYSYFDNNPLLGQSDMNPYAGLEAAAQAGDEAARAQLETLYAQRDAELQGQLTYAGEQKTNTLSELDRQLQNYFSGVDKQKVQTNEDVASSIGEAASTAQNVQRQNRNVLRGLGILNSTYAGDQLAQPMNAFDTQRAQLQKWGLSQIANLDDQKRQKQGEADSQRNQIVSQFNDLMGKIQTDMRFSQREKIGAMQAAQAALQQRVAEINTQKVAYQQQINQTKTALLSDLVKLQMAQSPKADISSVMGKSMAMINQMYTPQPQQGISIYGSTVPDQKKKSVYGNG